MVLLLYGVYTEYLTLNSDFSMTFQSLKTELIDFSLIRKKVLSFLRKISRKMLMTQFILNIIRQFIPNKILPSRHLMLFQRRYDIVRCRKTSHQRLNNVVFLQGLILPIKEYIFPLKNFIQHYGYLLYTGNVHLPQEEPPP